ncbi:hypothetical protein Tco_0544335, partial [Tanacetum coccineum]
ITSILHGLCLLEEALACDRKATLSDAREEDDVLFKDTQIIV